MSPEKGYLVRYLTHPQVVIDPDVPVKEWSLTDQGCERARALAASGRLDRTTRIISSGEVKARQTADILAEATGVSVEQREAMHENDRTSTGFLKPAEFEAVADAFFADPDVSMRGWETARTAQERIVREVKDTLQQPLTGDVLFVGHGAVGTLLYCALSGVKISRAYDQGAGGGGNIFTMTFPELEPLSHWVSIEAFIAAK